MSKNDLHTALERLRGELKRLEPDDTAARLHVQHLIAEIETHSGGDATEHQRKSLVAKIAETVRRFEVEHPALTGYLGEIAAALS